jgi:protoheme IX farnesyltransferase
MKPLQVFAFLTAAAGFGLVIAGGLVTSTGSGLAVPDWPLSYGTLFPPMVGGIRFEHSHRVIAATVGLMTLVLAMWVIFSEQRRWVRRMAITAFGLVVLQGLLGGLTVLWQLPPQVSIAHACLGQIFFSTLVVLAMVLSPSWKQTLVAHPATQAPELCRLSFLATAAAVAQLALGATMRHTGWFPALLAAHLAGALAVLALAGKTAGAVLKRCRSMPLLRRPARTLMWLLLAQILLGIATFLSGRSVALATAHVAAGALILAACSTLSVSLYYFLADPIHPIDLTNRSLKIYLELTKPRLTFLAIVTALGGFFLAGQTRVPGTPAGVPGTFVFLLLGTTLVGAGAGALNQYLEREADGRMERTRGRPLPSGRISPDSALTFGIFCSVAGLLILALGTNGLAAGLAAATLVSYLFIYTPLKPRTALCTLVGAIPGALPPLIGWASARGELGFHAWPLFFILFLWQLPHFLAIACTWREDYARAGFKMLPVLDPAGGSTGRQIVLYCLALIPVSLLPAAMGSFGWFYFLIALASGLGFLGFGVATARARSRLSARRLFFASILYLPVLLTTMTLDRMIS